MSTVQDKIQAVVFDWAGTALDFGSMAPILGLQEAFRCHGLTLTGEEARGPMGIKKLDHVRAILAMSGPAARFVQVKGHEPNEADVLAVYATLEPLMDIFAQRRVELIPGHQALVQWLRKRGCKVGSTTGYTRETMGPILAAALVAGYEPDACITPSEAVRGRPAPWMLWRNLELLGCDAAWKAIKVGDTQVDMEEGRNAGTWCMGYSCCGNMMGLDQAELAALDEGERAARRNAAELELYRAGAHVVVEGPWQAKEAVLELEARLAGGERP